MGPYLCSLTSFFLSGPHSVSLKIDTFPNWDPSMLTIAIREPLVQSLKNQCPVKDNGKLIHSCFLYQFLICTEQSQIDDENRRLNGLILVIWSTLDSCGTKADQFITSCQTVHIWCIKSQLQSTNLAVQQTLSSSHKLGWWLGWNFWCSHYSEAQQPRATSSVCNLLDTAYRWDLLLLPSATPTSSPWWPGWWLLASWLPRTAWQSWTPNSSDEPRENQSSDELVV